MLKVLYDHQAFDMQMYGGVSNRAVQLISNLPNDIEVRFGVKKSQNIHLLESHMGNFKVPLLSNFERLLNGKHYFGKNVLHYYLQMYLQKMNRRYSKDLLKSGYYDIFHPTFFDWYFVNYLQSKPFVLTIHDLTAELYFSQDDQQVKARKLLMGKAAHIVVNSKYTYNQVVDYYNVSESKISVVYCGAPEHINFSKQKCFEFDYLLYVGDRCTSYKNFIPMLNNIRDFLLCHKNIKLLCTGKPFSQEEISIMSKMGIFNCVLHQNCTQSELFNLYSNALCFIYPSLNEGFGMPILEAFSVNCPVFLSRRSCFPEIAADAAVYFELDNKSGNLSEKLEEFLKWDAPQKESLLKRQRERLRCFSWKESAIRLSNIYQSICE